ncbi:hypothetical protein LMH73_003620 [Vibrio splendidus]|nr:hypothetical protein [Vibrio splendidus]MCC4883225.1 hypothetical protein [Vibrio splendidus]
MIKNIASRLFSDGTKELKKNVTIEYVKDIKKGLNSKGKPSPAVADSVSKAEFKTRYQALQYSNAGVLVIEIYLLWLTVSASSFMAFLLAIAFSFGLFIFYFQNAYQLWRARVVARNWDKKNKVLTTSYSQYVGLLLTKPMEFFPIALLFK